MKRYLFNLDLLGVGETEAEAWTDAVEQFNESPGDPMTVCNSITVDKDEDDG